MHGYTGLYCLWLKHDMTQHWLTNHITESIHLNWVHWYRKQHLTWVCTRFMRHLRINPEVVCSNHNETRMKLKECILFTGRDYYSDITKVLNWSVFVFVFVFVCAGGDTAAGWAAACAGLPPREHTGRAGTQVWAGAHRETPGDLPHRVPEPSGCRQEWRLGRRVYLLGSQFHMLPNSMPFIFFWKQQSTSECIICYYL